MRPRPMELREAIVAMLAEGASMRATARAYGVAHSMVRAYRDRYRAIGIDRPAAWPRGPRVAP
jgi:transposase-like protein